MCSSGFVLATCILTTTFAFSIGTNIGGTDDTLVPFAAGKEVVEAVEYKVSNLFGHTYSLLQRAGYINSKFGEELSPMDDEGGIWKLPKTSFQETKNNSKLKLGYEMIQVNLGFTWSNLTYSDLNIPLKSGLGLVLSVLLKVNEIPSAVRRQIELLSSIYHIPITNFTQLNGTTLDYVDDSQVQCDLDIAIVLDGSGSIGSNEFGEAKHRVNELAAKVMEDGRSRVGLVIYSTTSSVIFKLDNNLTHVSLGNLIIGASYPGGSTATHLGIKDGIQLLEESNQTKAMVVFSDGRSDNPRLTITEGKKAKQLGIFIISIGIGSNLDAKELDGISSENRYEKVDSFKEISQILTPLKNRVCEIPHNATLRQIINKIQQYKIAYYVLEIESEGLTITLDVIGGKVTSFYSFDYQKPSSVWNDGQIHGSVFILPRLTRPSKRSTRDASSQKEFVYVSVAGLDTENEYKLSSKPGNPQPTSTTVKPKRPNIPSVCDIPGGPTTAFDKIACGISGMFH